MIKLSLEIPTPHLAEFMPECDLGFALAQEVLDDISYSDYYKNHTKTSILDNGMLETGTSLPVSSLWHAGKMIHASAIIAPDVLDDMNYSIAYYQDMVHGLESPWYTPAIGYVVQGKTLGERVWSLHYAYKGEFSPICLPYRTDREETMKTWIKMYNIAPRDTWFHLLGLKDFKELVYFRNLTDYCEVSIDTGKVFEIEIEKFALGHFAPVAKEQLPVDRRLTDEQIQTAHANIQILKARL